MGHEPKCMVYLPVRPTSCQRTKCTPHKMAIDIDGDRFMYPPPSRLFRVNGCNDTTYLKMGVFMCVLLPLAEPNLKTMPKLN